MNMSPAISFPSVSVCRSLVVAAVVLNVVVAVAVGVAAALVFLMLKHFPGRRGTDMKAAIVMYRICRCFNTRC